MAANVDEITDSKRIDSVRCDEDEGTFEKSDRAVELVAAQQMTLTESPSLLQTFKQDKKVFAVVSAALASALILGTDTTAVNSLVGSQSFCYVMGGGYKSNGKYAVTPKTVSIWSAVAAPAQVLGQFSMGPIADWFGRRAVIYFNVCVMIIGVIIEFVAPNWKVFAAAKFLLAYVAGLTQATAPMYISELAPRNARGAMISCFLIISTCGDLISVVLCYVGQQVWPEADNKWAYRMPLLVCVILPVIVLALQLFLLVESPAWLVMHGKSEQAKKSIRFMYPNRTEEERDLIYAEYEYTLGQEAEKKELMKESSFVDCFRVGIGVTGLSMKLPYNIMAGHIMLAFLCIGSYSSTLGPNASGWIYIGESGSMRLRAKTTTLGALGNGILGTTYNIAIPYMLQPTRLGVGGSAI
ncbi:hypothetical protein SBRCBS47491_009069 [Sporothrix bragantina]|uniref:Major facilitator superfamily (MFS) profile domain-containing protein n=1 Tax=Sporothrix bragantina TaxID=671064 RepID=A0ABP0CUC9_9PEZI